MIKLEEFKLLSSIPMKEICAASDMIRLTITQFFWPGDRRDLALHIQLPRSLLYFAGKIDDKLLMNQIIDRIQDENISHGYLFSRNEIQEVYAPSEENKGLKHYLVMLMEVEMVRAQDADVIEAGFDLTVLIPSLERHLTNIIEDRDRGAVFNSNTLGARTRLRH